MQLWTNQYGHHLRTLTIECFTSSVDVFTGHRDDIVWWSTKDVEAIGKL